MTTYPDTGIAPPSVRPSTCLDQRHRSVGCTRCVGSCPVAALTLDDAMPHLDADACVACGACASVCPTTSFDPLRRNAERLLCSSFEEEAGSPRAIVCPMSPIGRSTAPVEASMRHTRCLAAIDATDLIEIAIRAQSDVWLDVAPCANCSIGTNRSTIEHTASTANALLGAIEDAGTIQCSVEEVEPHPVREVNAGEGRVSRRGLVSAITGTAREMSERSDDAPTPAVGAMSRWLPERRKRLLRLLADTLPDDTTFSPHTAPFGMVDVDAQRCTACSLCATFCPTGALVFDSNSEAFLLGFSAPRCIDCGICVVACADDALTNDGVVTLPSTDADHWVQLISGAIAPCRVCGTPTSAIAIDGPMCSACRHGAGVVKPLVDGAGLLDDLLSRQERHDGEA